jgi:hypothetical protein
MRPFLARFANGFQGLSIPMALFGTGLNKVGSSVVPQTLPGGGLSPSPLLTTPDTSKPTMVRSGRRLEIAASNAEPILPNPAMHE